MQYTQVHGDLSQLGNSKLEMLFKVVGQLD